MALGEAVYIFLNLHSWNYSFYTQGKNRVNIGCNIHQIQTHFNWNTHRGLQSEAISLPHCNFLFPAVLAVEQLNKLLQGSFFMYF